VRRDSYSMKNRKGAATRVIVYIHKPNHSTKFGGVSARGVERHMLTRMKKHKDYLRRT
jgi:hypothetical protein